MPPQLPIRLAILEADTPLAGTQARYGGYSGVFTTLLHAACSALSPPLPPSTTLTITRHHVVPDLEPPGSLPEPETTYPALDDIDAVLITGSKHTAFAEDEWIAELVDFTRRAIAGGRVRVVGVCFGHQIVARAEGVEVKKGERGWEVAVTEVGLTEKGKEVFGMEKMRIHQMHRDEVTANPPGAESLAFTEICPVQGFLAPGKYITVQGHPEFSSEIVTEILHKRHDMGIFSDQVFEDGLSRVGNQHDGVMIAKAFLEFLMA